MKLLYEAELTTYLTQSKEEVIAYAKKLVESQNAINFQKANELSFIMRRNKKMEEAVEISRMMFEQSKTEDRLNLYFVAVIDQGDINRIHQLSTLTDTFLKEKKLPYLNVKHLYATWLKAANRILDDDLFQYVYNQIPSNEKTDNTYIISQYYVYKNRHSQYEDVCKHYEELPVRIQNSFYVKRYYENARARMGLPPVSSNSVPLPDVASTGRMVATPVVPQVHDKQDEETKEKQVFIVYGGNPVNLSVIEAFLRASKITFINLSKEDKTGSTIIEAFENRASKADFAIVLCTPENEGVNNVWYARQNVIFEYGYFIAKLGRKNVCLLWQENGKKLEIPSDISGIYQISLDRGSWIEEFREALKNAGFSVAF